MFKGFRIKFLFQNEKLKFFPFNAWGQAQTFEYHAKILQTLNSGQNKKMGSFHVIRQWSNVQFKNSMIEVISILYHFYTASTIQPRISFNRI